MRTHMLKPRLDQGLPIIQRANLYHIVNLYLGLAGRNRHHFGPHTKFALTGHLETEGETCRVSLFDSREVVDSALVKQTCDIDSAVGFVFRGERFPIQPGYSLFVHSLNNTEYTLQSSLHVPPFSFPDDAGNPVYAEPHKIPHIYLGFMGGASVSQIPVRMMFPRQYTKREARDGNMINKMLMEVLYNKGLYVAAKASLPKNNLAFWPVSFNAEVFRAGKDSGGVGFAQRAVPEEFADAFFASLHRAIDNCPELDWARDFFLQIQAQGTKESTVHVVDVPQMDPGIAPEPSDAERIFQRERTRQITRAVRPIDMTKVISKNWLIDIATTISLDDPEHSLLIRKHTHERLISLLTGVSLGAARDIISRGARGGYYFDEFFHTGIFGGQRLTVPLDVDSPYHVVYEQAYTTDKVLTAHKQNGKYAKELEPGRAFRQMKNVEVKFLEPLRHLTKEALNEKRQIHIRFESRVRLPFAWDVHRKYDPDVLCLLTSMLKSTHIWGWRVIRIEAIRETFRAYRRNISSVPRPLLPQPASLILGLTWMANAMISRPKEGGEWDVLRDTLSVHAIVDGVLVPVRPLNIFFVHSLLLDPCPRLSSHRYLGLKSISVLLNLAKGAADSELVKLMTGNKQRKSLAAQRDGDEENEMAERSFVRVVVNRAARMTTHVPDSAPPVFTEEEAASLPEVADEWHYASEEEDPQQQHDTFSNLRTLNSIFLRMASEMLRKVPSTADHRSWRKISEAEACELGWEALCDATQLDHLMVSWVQEVDDGKWNTVVNRLFPDLETYTRKTAEGKPYMQNVASCSWFQDYAAILDDRTLSDADKAAFTNQARKKLREEAEWLPMGLADRMWGAGPKKAKLMGPRIGKNVPGIVLNPNPLRGHQPNVNIPGGRLIIYDV